MSSDPSDSENGKYGKSYAFGPFIVDTKQGVLLRDGEPVKIAPKTFQLLRLLVENNGQIVDKTTIMQEIWPDSFVEDANLTVHISTLRKTLNGDLPGAATIETFPKVGYRFQADVKPAGRSEEMGSSTVGDEFFSRKAKPTGRIKPIWLWLTASVITVSLISIGYLWVSRSRHVASPLMVRVPGTESSSSIALSPDGQFIAHAISKNGKRALTMTNIGSGSSVQLIPPDDSLYWGMKFSRDNSYLYFVRFKNEEFTLERIPVLGGRITVLAHDFPQGLSISPDGTKICYVRQLSDGSSVMYTANSDTSGEKEIARRAKPENYSSLELAWSPDGKQIANLARISPDEGSKLVSIDVETGKETVLSDKKWAGGDGIAWLPDQSGIVGGLFESGNSATQVWMVPLNGGEPRKITTDLENYGSVDISADGQIILAGQFKDESSLWIQQEGMPLDARPITDEKHHLFKWVRWKGENELVFASSIGNNRDIWSMDTLGANQTQITANAKANIMADASPDGSTIYFCSNRAGKGAFNIYRSNAVEQDVTQLTFGSGEFQPAASPDGKWIYYTAGNPGDDETKMTVWKISTDGGDPLQLTNQPSFYSATSPDSRFLAFWIKPAENEPWKVGVMETANGRIVKYLDVPRSNPLAWNPKGDGISFIKNIDGVGNIWTQPIGGGAAIQETKFTSDQIVNFDWSSKGQLVCSRNSRSRDVFLIRNFR